AVIDQSGDRAHRARDHSLNRSVPAVPHPAGEPAAHRGFRDPSAETDALHATAHNDPADRDLVRHWISPLSTARAAFNPEAAQRARSCTYDSGKFQSRAAATTVSR